MLASLNEIIKIHTKTQASKQNTLQEKVKISVYVTGGNAMRRRSNRKLNVGDGRSPFLCYLKYADFVLL